MPIQFIFPTLVNDLKALQDTIDTLHCSMIFDTLDSLNLTYEEISQVLKITQSILSTQSAQTPLGEAYGE